MLVSVIIPTYKRPESVLRLLRSLSRQTLPPDQFEVIVVDDGSRYDPALVTGESFPFPLHYMRQANQGATIARNNGVEQSKGEVLIFIDDDVTPSPPALAALAETARKENRALVLGVLTSRSDEHSPSIFTQMAADVVNSHPIAGRNGAARSPVHSLHFSWCNTQLLAVRRTDFMVLGMLQDPTGGWPNWDDVDFGYRAHLAGYRLLQDERATAVHWDRALSSLEAACRRWQRATHSAVRLFRVHPGLQRHIPMLEDKTPIQLGQDSPALIARKLGRRVMAMAPIVSGMETAVSLLERVYPSRPLLGVLYRWIQGSYMYRGYRTGLQAEQTEENA